MKNIFIAIFSILSISTFAQEQDMMDEVVVEKELKSSFGPKKGDITIGLDIIVPIVRAVGTGYSAGTPEQILTDFPDKQTFVAKYFLKDDFAIRAKIQANVTNITDSQLIKDDSKLDPLSKAKVEDVNTVNTGDFAFAIGGEFRNAHGQLNTFYGGEIIGLYGYSSEKFHRANTFTSVNTSPTYYDYDKSIETSGEKRMISRNNGNYWGLGVNAVVGAEYFFTNWLAVGSELTWGYQYIKTGQKYHVNEYMLGDSVKEETKVTSADDLSNTLGFANPYVSLYVMFTL